MQQSISEVNMDRCKPGIEKFGMGGEQQNTYDLIGISDNTCLGGFFEDLKSKLGKISALLNPDQEPTKTIEVVGDEMVIRFNGKELKVSTQTTLKTAEAARNALIAADEANLLLLKLIKISCEQDALNTSVHATSEYSTVDNVLIWLEKHGDSGIGENKEGTMSVSGAELMRYCKNNKLQYMVPDVKSKIQLCQCCFPSKAWKELYDIDIEYMFGTHSPLQMATNALQQIRMLAHKSVFEFNAPQHCEWKLANA